MQRPPADLGSGHRRERVGGSEDGLVEHHGLGGHHRHTAHLTHLGVDLGVGGGGWSERRVWERTNADVCWGGWTHHSVHRHLWCGHGERHGRRSLLGGRGGETSLAPASGSVSHTAAGTGARLSV